MKRKGIQHEILVTVRADIYRHSHGLKNKLKESTESFLSVLYYVE